MWRRFIAEAAPFGRLLLRRLGRCVSASGDVTLRLWRRRGGKRWGCWLRVLLKLVVLCEWQLRFVGLLLQLLGRLEVVPLQWRFLDGVPVVVGVQVSWPPWWGFWSRGFCWEELHAEAVATLQERVDRVHGLGHLRDMTKCLRGGVRGKEGHDMADPSAKPIVHLQGGRPRNGDFAAPLGTVTRAKTNMGTQRSN